MAVLNVTPDSFADADHFTDVGRAVDVALRLEAEGADLIDIGGESTRPGADAVPAAIERARVLPVVRQLAGQLQIPVSVDTYKADVARAALEQGAAIINDVSGLRYEPALAGVVAAAGSALVLMHTRGRSKAMYADATYANLIPEVISELEESVAIAVEGGLRQEQLILDPGLGFAKHAVHSYGVLARLQDIAKALKRPMLIGPSRKSFLCEAIGGIPAPERDWGTAAAVTAAVLGGAHIVRVHAVAEMTQVVRVAEAIRRHSDPA